MHYTESKLRQLAFHIVPKSAQALSQSIKDAAEGTTSIGKAGKLPQPQLASKETCVREKKLLTDNLQKQLETKKTCSLKADQMVKTKSSTEEDVQEERFTYLEAQVNDIPKFTAVLAHLTNKAEYCLIAIGYLFRLEQVRKQLATHDYLVYQAFAVTV